MGRKIPGKKHRNVVDPQKQRAKRLQSLKNKINNPPQNPDEQEIPRSLLTIMNLKKETQEGENVRRRTMRKKRRKNKLLSVEQFLDKDVTQPGMKEPEKYIPKLVQHPDETPERFYHRVNSMAQKIIQETQFEDKFGVTIKKDAQTGKVLKVEKNQKMKSFKNESKKKSLSQKRKEKMRDKASKNDGKDFSQLKDVVEFGEVIHRPPNVLNLHKKLKAHPIKKKDKYKDLLLQSVINSCSDQSKQVKQK